MKNINPTRRQLQTSASSYPEVGENILSLDILSSQTNLPESVILITLKVSQGHLEHTVLESFWSNLIEKNIEFR